MIDAGTYLKERREFLGLSFESVQNATGIRALKIRALEENRLGPNRNDCFRLAECYGFNVRSVLKLSEVNAYDSRTRASERP